LSNVKGYDPDLEQKIEAARAQWVQNNVVRRQAAAEHFRGLFRDAVNRFEDPKEAGINHRKLLGRVVLPAPSED